MKVIMVAPYFYPRGGGLENYVYNISRELLTGHGVEVSVICSNWGHESYAEEVISGLKVYRLPHLFKISTTPVHPLWSWRFSSIVASEKPDLINSHTPVPYAADVAARIAHHNSIPYVLTCHDALAQSLLYAVLSKLYFSFYGNTTLKYTNQFIVNSPQTARYFDSLEIKYGDKITVVAPGVDISLFRPLERQVTASKLILFVGQLFPASRKGLDVLIRALSVVLKQFQDARLLVAGPGPVSPYQKLAGKLGITRAIEFLGELDHTCLPEYYNLADVVVLPSCKSAEGFGMSLIEAQACRRPVIGTKVGGIPFAVIDAETGLLVPRKDPEKLAQAIVRLLEDRKLAGRLASNGYRRVTDEFTWEKSAARTLQVYQRALSGK